ncbi:MAG: peptidoglycan-associated lipoprotein Pal [Desulfovibrio sp.]|uniref:peptidoglycan-associated lipoprotein Pal n=1 Tax=Desulfovibrio sp. 7SRBS1 TaxID=3378064 RepID=UPI003B403E05
MKAVIRMILIVAAVAALAFAAGCGSKTKVESTPPGVTGVKHTGPSAAELERDKQAELAAAKERELEEQRLREQQDEELRAQKAEAYTMAVEEVGNMIHFDFDSYQLKPEARELLQRKAEYLKSFPQLRLVVEGYCDDRGTEEYNLALGERRARAAYEFLVLLGISPDRMSIVSYGEEDPVDPGNNEVAWAKNRRDQFRIIK